MLKITTTQALLLLIKARYDGWNPIGKEMSRRYLSLEVLYDFLLDGPSFDKKEYDMFLDEWNALRQSNVPATALIAKQCDIFDSQYFDPLISTMPSHASEVPFNYKYMFPSEYETAPDAFLKSYIGTDPDSVDVFSQYGHDLTRLIFETTMARNVLAVTLSQKEDENLIISLRNWNIKLVSFLNEVRRKKMQSHSDPFQCGEIERRLRVYHILNNLVLPLESIPPPDTVFIGWPAWKRPQVHHEVYDIIMIMCSANAQRQDSRLTQNRMELIRQVALSWMLINSCMKNFNTKLYHYDFLNNNIMVESFRGRVNNTEAEKRDKPWSEPDANPQRPFLPPSQVDRNYDVREMGIIRSRSVLPLYDAQGMRGHYKYGGPTFFKVPEDAPSYAYRKALENVRILNTSAWAKFCRGRKVHPMIGGGSGSFFYVLRMLLSTQAAAKDVNIFPGYAYSEYPTCHNLNGEQIKEFLKILTCLWVGVTGGHCFLETLFIMNLRLMNKSFSEICNTELACDLPTFLRLKGQGPLVSIDTLIHTIKIAADYTSVVIGKKILHQELKMQHKNSMPQKDFPKFDAPNFSDSQYFEISNSKSYFDTDAYQ